MKFCCTDTVRIRGDSAYGCFSKILVLFGQVLDTALDKAEATGLGEGKKVFLDTVNLRVCLEEYHQE